MPLSPALQGWLTSYEESHRHPINQRIHKVCVPLILFHILAMLDWLPLGTVAGVPLTLAHVLGVGALAFYLTLSVPYALVMVAAGGLCLWLGALTPWPVVVAIAVLAWGVQLYGHHLEQRSPALVANLTQLLIGPLFVIALLAGHHRTLPWSPPSPGRA